jgi:hypothetical protein
MLFTLLNHGYFDEKGGVEMLDKLIEDGLKLESESEPGMVGKILTGVNFEAWVSRVIYYLERNYPNSAITERAVEVYKKLGTNSYSNYEFLLGTLKGIKEYEEQDTEEYSI